MRSGRSLESRSRKKRGLLGGSRGSLQKRGEGRHGRGRKPLEGGKRRRPEGRRGEEQKKEQERGGFLPGETEEGRTENRGPATRRPCPHGPACHGPAGGGPSEEIRYVPGPVRPPSGREPGHGGELGEEGRPHQLPIQDTECVGPGERSYQGRSPGADRGSVRGRVKGSFR